MSRSRKRFAGGLAILRNHRDGNGRWRRFPFYYTLLALSEMPGNRAADEMRYAAPGLERMLKRRGSDDRYDLRRRALARRILEMI